MLSMQLRLRFSRGLALDGAARIPDRDADRTGLEGVGDRGRLGTAIVAVGNLPAYGRSAVGCTDSRVAGRTVCYIEVWTAPAQAAGFRRAMDVLIGGWLLGDLGF